MDNGEPNVLFVDDDRSFLEHIIRSMRRRDADFECHAAICESEALDIAERIRPEVVVVDLGIDGSNPESGLVLAEKLFSLLDSVRILVLTGHGEDEWGMRCVGAGIASFLLKPVDHDHLLALIKDGIKVSRLLRADKARSCEGSPELAALGLTTESDRMKEVIDQVAFAAATPTPVLLCGETGVGKGFIAQTIHQASRRSEGPFVRTQPAFGSHDLVSSELFGHTRGSFTGASESRTGLIEEADGGTLFLDEIDALPEQTQVAMLHVLQEKEFQKIGSNKRYRSDFRLISATNMPFDELVNSRLRRDFYHRIAHTVIHIPPLRDRRGDIPHLARQFLSKIAAEYEGSNVHSLSHESCTWLASQQWPGNVRELYAAVEGGYMRAKFNGRRFISLSDLQKPFDLPDTPLDASLSEHLRVYELSITSTVFAKNRHNYSATARALGIDRKRLKRILSRAECLS